MIVFWLNLWLKGRTIRWGGWSISLAVLVVLTATMIEEALQALSPLRSVDLGDLLSGMIGVGQSIITILKG